MALKRYELPPPRYFDELPDRVLTRLERGEGKPSFLENFLQSVVIRPALAYSCALAALSALTWSIVYSVRNAPTEPSRAFANGWQNSAEATAGQASDLPRWANANATNPVLGSSPMFDLGTHPIPMLIANP